MKQSGIHSARIVCMIFMIVAMQTACVDTKPASPKQVADANKLMAGSARTWQRLAEDDLHDAGNPGIKLLQEPGVSLSTLPANMPRMSVGSYRTVGKVVNMDGNKVDWVQALTDGIISPRRARIPSGTPLEREELVMDMDMFLDLGGSMPIVRFPHLAHTMWLACSNCHPDIFVPQSGANRISMEGILSGEKCGICHRAVSFPPTDCGRCHSISNKSEEADRIRAAAKARMEARAKMDAEAAARAKADSSPKEKGAAKKAGARP